MGPTGFDQDDAKGGMMEVIGRRRQSGLICHARINMEIEL
jgi:hypothetical protein